MDFLTPEIHKGLLLVWVAPEKVFEKSAATTENDLVCRNLFIVFTDQSDIGQVFVFEQCCKSIFCVQTEVFPHQS